MTLNTTSGYVGHLKTKTANGPQKFLDVPAGYAPIDADVEGNGVSWAFRRSDGQLGLVTPEGLNILTKSTFGKAIALSTRGGAWIAISADRAPDGKYLEVYRRDGMDLTKVAETRADDADAAPLRMYRGGAETYLVNGTKLYRVDGASLASLPWPSGSHHNFAAADDGTLFVGYADPRASVSKLQGGAWTAVGQPQFSRDEGPAYVYPVGSDVYAAIASNAAPRTARSSCAPARRACPIRSPRPSRRSRDHHGE
jgi:hypothetical protein